jgi:hypothetical protein
MAIKFLVDPRDVPPEKATSALAAAWISAIRSRHGLLRPGRH